ncbi:MAG: FAD-binding protein, partial [Leptolyngbya sp. SIO4C5]|nr:FAD-binding protein [Leptolyngbya sp. SIO4C5]
GLIKKLISIHAWPIPSYFQALQPYLPEGKHAALLMVAEPSLELFEEMVKAWGAEITYRKSAVETGKGTAIAEFTWNHTTLHARSVDPSFTYLQTLFPHDPELKLVEHMINHFGDEVLMHLEFFRVEGKVIPAALQLVRYTSEKRLNEIIRYHEDKGAFIANPHTYIMEDGGRKTINPAQVNFKAQVDPYGLLNPGKMRGWLERRSQ